MALHVNVIPIIFIYKSSALEKKMFQFFPQNFTTSSRSKLLVNSGLLAVLIVTENLNAISSLPHTRCYHNCSLYHINQECRCSFNSGFLNCQKSPLTSPTSVMLFEPSNRWRRSADTAAWFIIVRYVLSIVIKAVLA